MKKRKLFEKVLNEKSTNKISIIIGPRQVGKTTILKALYEKLCIDHKCLFLDLDILENLEQVNSFDRLINILKLNGYKDNQKEYFYLFLDEFQRYDGVSIIMKNVYDNCKNIKIYASGSSSLKIKEQVQESLAGRKKMHFLYPLDFEEFLWFKEDTKAIEQFNNIRELSGEGLKIPYLQNFLYEFMVYGGYPEVVLTENNAGKIEILKNIFDFYVKKDLVGYLKFGKILGVKKLIEYLAVNNAQKIRSEEVADRCSMRQYEVKDYIEILKETFLVLELRPFFTNKNKELVKMPKMYFIDNGVRNFFINNFNPINLRNDSGFLFEGYILGELIKAGHENIKYWQDKNRHEVDFIIDFVSNQIPIEAKFKNKLKRDDFIGMNMFLKSYPKIKQKYLINIGTQKKIQGIDLRLAFFDDLIKR
ncbi:MAG: ATP-binding protein [Nanoarchaeota archaeon]|nr:ATP-binding protein [Nanoarchaeota archaeon]